MGSPLPAAAHLRQPLGLGLRLEAAVGQTYLGLGCGAELKLLGHCCHLLRGSKPLLKLLALLVQSPCEAGPPAALPSPLVSRDVALGRGRP